MRYLNLIARLLLFSVLIAPPLLLSGQNGFIQGILQLSSGDTLHGLIGLEKWNQDPGIILFKDMNASDITPYYPEDIIAAITQNEVYRTAEITQYPGPEDKKEEKVLNTEFEPVQVILKELVGGFRSLYMLQRNDEEDIFYILRDGVFELLIPQDYITKLDDPLIVKIGEGFRWQLYTYLNCHLLQRDFENVQYKEDDLKRIFNFYYLCDSDPINYIKDAKTWQVGLKFFSGASFTNLSILSNKFSELKEVVLEPSINMTIGTAVEAYKPGFGRTRLVRSEITLTKYMFDDISSYGPYRYRIELEQTSLNINILYQWGKPFGNVLFYYNGGLFAGGNLVGKSRITRSLNGNTEVLNANNRRMEIGLISSLGVESGGMMCEFRYAIGNGLIFGEEVDAVTHRFMVFLGLSIPAFYGSNK